MSKRPRLSADDAAALLRRGGVIAYPTEGVWGLGCDPFNQQATLRLLAIKQRDPAKGLILVASVIEQFDGIADWTALTAPQRGRVVDSWPGPNTWIVPAAARVPPWLRGAHDGIALRIGDHPLVRGLCKAFGGAIVSTSANTSGMPAPRHRDELERTVLDQVDAITEGETSGRSQPSTIRDARTGRTLRP